MKEKLDKKLESRNIRPTAMRELVLRILAESKSTVSLAELEKELETADKATIYRTLKTFEENKLIHKIDDGTGSIKYALCKETCQCRPEELHVHFLCDMCHHTFCLNDVPVPRVDLPTGFSVENINLVIKGICATCR